MHNRLLFSILFFFIVVCGFSQHLIIKKNGDKIYCRIVAEDSTLIYYTKPAQKSTFQINKSEIEKYYSSQRMVPAEQPSATAVAEEPEELLLINISGGQASPRGDFESQDLYSPTSGLAKRGYVVKAMVVLKVAKNFGFCAAYRLQANRFNDKLLSSQLNSVYQGVNFTSESSSWRVRGFFGGVYFNFPFKKIRGFAIDFDISAGLPKCDFADITITANQNGRYSTYRQNARSTHSPAVLAGAGFKYSFNKTVGMSFNVNYMAVKAVFTDVYTVQFSGQSSYSDYTQKMNSLSVQAGLSFFLFQKDK